MGLAELTIEAFVKDSYSCGSLGRPKTRKHVYANGNLNDSGIAINSIAGLAALYMLERAHSLSDFSFPNLLDDSSGTKSTIQGLWDYNNIGPKRRRKKGNIVNTSKTLQTFGT